MGKGSRQRAVRQRERIRRARERHPADPVTAMLPYYVEVVERTLQDPKRSADIADLDEQIYPLIVGIAYADQFGHSIESQRAVADLIKEWHVLNGYCYLYEWPDPIAAMTEDQVIAAIRAERDSGRIPPPVPETAD